MGYNSKDFTYKRLQAQRNVETHIATLLYAAAKSIAYLSSTYRTGLKDISMSEDFAKRARGYVEQAESRIESYITQYASASAKLLGISDDAVKSYLKEVAFGKTFVERNHSYCSNFAEDIIKMVSAGIQMGYTQSQLLSAVRTGYKNPFKTSVVTKAQRKGISIATPSYGKGFYRSAYQNIIRNAQGTISLAWGKALEEFAEENGEGYFRVFRGSSYPCETCDYETTYIHSLRKDPMPPFHLNCVCGIEFTNKEDSL